MAATGGNVAVIDFVPVLAWPAGSPILCGSFLLVLYVDARYGSNLVKA